MDTGHWTGHLSKIKNPDTDTAIYVYFAGIYVYLTHINICNGQLSYTKGSIFRRMAYKLISPCQKGHDILCLLLMLWLKLVFTFVSLLNGEKNSHVTECKD